jgi:hypothetical protein
MIGQTLKNASSKIQQILFSKVNQRLRASAAALAVRQLTLSPWHNNFVDRMVMCMLILWVLREKRFGLTA